MPNRKACLSALVCALGCVAFSTFAADQTVDQLIATDARTALANEEAAAAKAERAAREAAGLPPPAPPGAMAAPAAKVVPPKVYELVSILGYTGHRSVRFKVDGQSFELSEGGEASRGYRLAGIQGTCATVVEVRDAGDGSKRAARKAAARAAAGGTTHNLCYVAPVPFNPQSLRLGSVGGALPPPVSLGTLPPPLPASATTALPPPPASIALPGGGSVPVAQPASQP